jgi:hypothetical protein
MKRSRYSLLLRCLLALVALAGVLYWGANTHDSLEKDLHSGGYARYAFTVNPDTRAVIALEPEAALGGMVKGSVVQSINGWPRFCIPRVRGNTSASVSPPLTARAARQMWFWLLSA